MHLALGLHWHLIDADYWRRGCSQVPHHREALVYGGDIDLRRVLGLLRKHGFDGGDSRLCTGDELRGLLAYHDGVHLRLDECGPSVIVTRP